MDVVDGNADDMQQTASDDAVQEVVMDTSLMDPPLGTTQLTESMETSVCTDAVEALPVTEIVEKSIPHDKDAPVDINDIIELQPSAEVALSEDGSSVDMFKGDNTNENVDQDKCDESKPGDFEDDKNANICPLDDTDNKTVAATSTSTDDDDQLGETEDLDKASDMPDVAEKEPNNVNNSNDIGINTGSVTDSASEDDGIAYDTTIKDSCSTDNFMDYGEENGIVINENDIVTAADMYGRGKRSKPERKSRENMSDDEGDGEDNLLSLRGVRREQNYANNPYSRSPHKRRYSSPGRKAKSTRKVLAKNFDEDKILLPLKHGWRREVVIRNVFDKLTTTGGVKQTPADVYYHPPKGRKLRSMKEIIDYLKKTGSPFTEDNFSLLRRQISEPPFEVVRHAGKSKGRNPIMNTMKDEDSSFDTSFDKPEVVIERADEEEGEIIEEVKKEKPFTSTPVSSILKRAKVKVTPMRSTFKYQGRGRPPKNKQLPHLTKTKNLLYRHSSKFGYHGVTETLIKDVTVTMPDFSRQDSDMDDSSTPESPPAKRFKATARKSTTQKYFKPAARNSSQQGAEALCTLSCPGQENIPPSLQCVVCLCLFHPLCVAYTPSDNPDFTCLRCFDPSQMQPRPKTITVMRVGPASRVATSPQTSAPVIKQEPLDPEQPTPGTPKDVNPTLLEHLRTSILERQVVPTIAGRTVSILSPVQPSQAGMVGPRSNTLSASTVVSPSTQNLPNLSLLSDSLRRGPVQRTIYMTPSGMVTHSTVTPQTTMLVPAASLLGNAQGAVSTMQLPRLVAPVPQMHYVSPTPTTPSLRAPVLSMMPPRLIAAPKTPPVMLVDSNKTSPIASHLTNGTTSQDVNGKTGQILTLPSAVAKRLNLQQPLALKINNVQITVPPSSFLFTTDGLKLFLPPKTFPLQLGETAKLSVTVTNDKSNASQPEVSVNINTEQLDSPRLGSIKPLTGVVTPPTVHSKAVSNTSHRKTRWRAGINPGMCYVKKLYGGFDCMFCIFQYLNMKDLLRVAMVCRTWRQLAMHPSHWRNLTLRDLKILDWEKAIDFMLLRAVQSLNLRGLVHDGDKNRTWHQLIPHMHKLSCLRQISFGIVPASVLHMFSEKVSHLEVFNAEMITDMTNQQMWSVPTKLDVGKFSALTQLRQLRLRGVGGLLLPSFSFSGGLTQLGTMKNLTTLSLTSLKEVDDQEFGFLAELTKLEVLELGHCSTWSSETYFHLGRLKQLKCLRLESGGEMPDIGLGDSLLNMKELEKLELIMFVIAESLHTSLSQLQKLSHLVMWPDTSSQPAALVNSHVLAVVSRLPKLKKLEWGIMEDKDKSVVCDRNDNTDNQKMSRAEWIPFLSAGLPADAAEIPDNASVQYMSVHQFTEKLAIIHPTTEIKVFSTELLNARQTSEES